MKPWSSITVHCLSTSNRAGKLHWKFIKPRLVDASDTAEILSPKTIRLWFKRSVEWTSVSVRDERDDLNSVKWTEMLKNCVVLTGLFSSRYKKATENKHHTGTSQGSMIGANLWNASYDSLLPRCSKNYIWPNMKMILPCTFGRTSSTLGMMRQQVSRWMT